MVKRSRNTKFAKAIATLKRKRANRRKRQRGNPNKRRKLSGDLTVKTAKAVAKTVAASRNVVRRVRKTAAAMKLKKKVSHPFTFKLSTTMFPRGTEVEPQPRLMAGAGIALGPKVPKCKVFRSPPKRLSFHLAAARQPDSTDAPVLSVVEKMLNTIIDPVYDVAGPIKILPNEARLIGNSFNLIQSITTPLSYPFAYGGASEWDAMTPPTLPTSLSVVGLPWSDYKALQVTQADFVITVPNTYDTGFWFCYYKDPFTRSTSGRNLHTKTPQTLSSLRHVQVTGGSRPELSDKEPDQGRNMFTIIGDGGSPVTMRTLHPDEAIKTQQGFHRVWVPANSTKKVRITYKVPSSVSPKAFKPRDIPDGVVLSSNAITLSDAQRAELEKINKPFVYDYAYGQNVNEELIYPRFGNHTNEDPSGIAHGGAIHWFICPVGSPSQWWRLYNNTNRADGNPTNVDFHGTSTQEGSGTFKDTNHDRPSVVRSEIELEWRLTAAAFMPRGLNDNINSRNPLQAQIRPTCKKIGMPIWADENIAGDENEVKPASHWYTNPL